MKAIKAYLSSWRSIWKYRFPIAFLYLANIVFTFIVTSPYTIYFKQKMQHSDVLDNFDGFDISMVAEFINNYGEGLVPLMTLFIILIVFYYMFGIYASSAVLYAVVSRNNYIPLRSFWSGGLSYFWRIFRLSIYYVFGILILIITAWYVLLSVGINILEVESDDEIAFKIKVAIVIIGVFVGILSMIKQYAKINIAIHNLPFITSAILKSSNFVFKNFLQAFLLYIINIASLILFFVIYVNVRSVLNINVWLLTFILAQMFLIFKIVFRIVHLHSCFDFCICEKEE